MVTWSLNSLGRTYILVGRAVFIIKLHIENDTADASGEYNV